MLPTKKMNALVDRINHAYNKNLDNKRELIFDALHKAYKIGTQDGAKTIKGIILDTIKEI